MITQDHLLFKIFELNWNKQKSNCWQNLTNVHMISVKHTEHWTDPLTMKTPSEAWVIGVNVNVIPACSFSKCISNRGAMWSCTAFSIMDTDLNTDQKGSGENKGGQQVYRLESGLNNGKHGCYYTNTERERDWPSFHVYAKQTASIWYWCIYFFNLKGEI